jgi:hypothetical protein
LRGLAGNARLPVLRGALFDDFFRRGGRGGAASQGSGQARGKRRSGGFAGVTNVGGGDGWAAPPGAVVKVQHGG